jgi:hypothetical protein
VNPGTSLSFFLQLPIELRSYPFPSGMLYGGVLSSLNVFSSLLYISEAFYVSNMHICTEVVRNSPDISTVISVKCELKRG